MLPPILELFIVWHPEDRDGDRLADQIFRHFMVGPTFSGIIGGGIQISLRSIPWHPDGGAPRPIYAEGHSAPNSIKPAKFVAVVPLLGLGMAKHVEDSKSAWHKYIESILLIQAGAPDKIGVFPYVLNRSATDGTKLNAKLGQFQNLAAGTPDKNGETVESMLCRDLSQGLAQLASSEETQRITTFISHTKRHTASEGADVDDLVDLVRSVVANTRLDEFFDASDLQPGEDWSSELRAKSGSSALLGLRTDLYSSREWCQREVTIAKTMGMPVVMMDAIGFGEERGSFLMDHVPRVAVRKEGGAWRKSDVYRALNLLVDECLKRALWIQQRRLADDLPELNIEWWAPHAPEPLTLGRWIEGYLEAGAAADSEEAVRILHPDPPLGPEELDFLRSQARLSSLRRDLDVMTPRQLASRGG